MWRTVDVVTCVASVAHGTVVLLSREEVSGVTLIYVREVMIAGA
jgi:hypothetical protein